MQRSGGTADAGARVNGILPLRLADVVFTAGGRTIIGGVNLTLAAGPSTIILGANGAGKSVLMRLMHGLLAPSSGHILWSGDGERRRQAMVFQRPVMLRRSALANVVYALAAAGVPAAERERQAGDALAEVGLAHLAQRPARVLSGGEQQRLALARAWALHPEVLFLDEPTANLDPGATREIETIIKAFDAAGTKIVMSTHSLGQARRLGDEVIFLHQGRVAERALIEEFFPQPASPEAAAFVKGELPWA
jgi:tungstate transport system ATP-binding protein